MYMFKHRPFMFGCVLSVAVLLISYALPLGIGMLLFVPILFALVSLKTVFRKRKMSFFGDFSRKIYAYICIMMLLTLTSFNAYQFLYLVPIERNYTNDKAMAEIAGYISDDGTAVIYGFENTPVPYKAVLNLTAPTDIIPYREFYFEGRIVDPAEYYSGDETYYKGKNITAVCEGKIEYTDKNVRSVGRMLYDVKSYCVECIETYCGEHGGFAAGLLLSADGKMPTSVYTDFKQTGTTHLCAVSGMHLVAVMAIFDFVFLKFIPSKPISTAAAIPICILYVLITGASMSVIRAGIMYLMCRAAFFAQADNDSLTSLSVATYLGFLIFPYSVYDTGFVLSIAATAGIIIFALPEINLYKGFLASHPFPKYIEKYISGVSFSLIYSLACTITVLPFLAVYYGVFCPLSPITTMLMSVPITAVLYISPLCIVFSFSPTIAGFFGKIAEAFSGLCIEIIDFCAEHFTFSVSLSMPFVRYITVLAVLLFVFFVVKKGSRREFAALFLSIALIFSCCNAVYMLMRKNADSLAVFSEGDGEIVCIVSDNEALIIDSTDGNAFESLYEVTGKLTEQGITSARYMITSCDYKHVHCIRRLARMIHIEGLYINATLKEENIATMAATAETDNIEYYFIDVTQNTVLNVGDIPVTVFPRVYDGEDYRTVYAVGSDYSYVYCPIPIYRVSNTAEKIISEASTVIYGTCKTEQRLNYFPVNNTYRAYIPEMLVEDGFSLHNEKTEAKYYEYSFFVDLE